MTVLKKQSAASRKLSWSDWLLAGFILIFVGYFLPWLKHQSVGLTLIGLDISEWLKFLPQFASGELPNRNYFYLPPVTLGAMVVLWSVLGKLNNRRGWIIAFVGCGLAFIAFPALEALPLNGEKLTNVSEWRFRLASIGLVCMLAVLRPLLARLPSSVVMGSIVFLALLGSVLPARLLYLSRSAYIFWLRLTPNPGLGFVLHLLGTMLVLWSIWVCFQNSRQQKSDV